MRRCAVCNYLETYGIPDLGIPPDNRRITWNKNHKEFQCTECKEEIKHNKFEMNNGDLTNIWADLTTKERLINGLFDQQMEVVYKHQTETEQ